MMNHLRKAWSRFRPLFRKEQLDAEMTEEMRAHIEMQTQENIKEGMKPEAARRAAARSFGAMESLKETCRDQRGGRWIEDLFQDLRYGARMLLKTPGFTVVAVFTLALGIGADTAIFSAVNALVVQPLPYKDSRQIAQLLQTDERTGRSSVEISPADFIDLKSQARAFEAISGWESRGDFVDQGQAAPPSVTWRLDQSTNDQNHAGGPLGVKGVAVSADLFSLLGVQPYFGRAVFFAEEAQTPKVIILSYQLWQARFGADPGVIGRTVHFSDTAYTVVGVLAPDFRFPTEPPAQWQPDLFVPLRLPKNGGHRSSSSLHALGRLKPGMSLEQAQAEVRTLAARLAKDYPESNSNRGVRVVRLRDSLVGQARPALLILFGAVSFVLLIACVNVMNLLLARASARTKEIAIRSALGAGRTRLVRLFLTESLLLAGLGGIGALMVASWFLKILLALLPENFPRIVPIHIDTWVLGFSSGVALLTALFLGTVPALRTSKVNLSQSLKGNRNLLPGIPRHRFRSALAIVEVSLASVLLVGAGLMIKSYWGLTHTHLGFNPQNVLAVETWPPGSGNARRDAYYQELFQRVQRLAGVQEVGLVDSLPLLGTDAASTIRVAGRPENHEMVGQRSISDNYFRVLQIPLIRGRRFAAQDTETSEKVVIINQALARRYFGRDDPIGQTIVIFEPVRVVGVVGDVKPNGFESLVVPEMYFPFRQWNTFGLRLLVRTGGRHEALSSSLRSEISAMDPAQLVGPIRPLEQILSTQVAPRRFNAILLGCFAVVGLAIALIGIYGVMSFSVSQRTHEFGVRMALGAQRGEVLKMVLRQGMLLSLTGALIGLAGAWGLTRLLSNLLYEVKPTDASTYLAASLCLVGVAVLSCLGPALRATRIDPMASLRYE